MQNNAMPKPLNQQDRVFGEYAGSRAAGAVYEHSFIWAKTEAQAVAAVDYFQSCSKPGMTTEERIDRAITLAECYDAEARHVLLPQRDEKPEWFA